MSSSKHSTWMHLLQRTGLFSFLHPFAVAKINPLTLVKELLGGVPKASAPNPVSCT